MTEPTWKREIIQIIRPYFNTNHLDILIYFLFVAIVRRSVNKNKNILIIHALAKRRLIDTSNKDLIMSLHTMIDTLFKKLWWKPFISCVSLFINFWTHFYNKYSLEFSCKIDSDHIGKMIFYICGQNYIDNE